MVRSTWLTAVAWSATSALALSAPAHAQDEDSAIAALVEESSTPGAGLAAARAQAEAGDLTEAAATLERVLLAEPNAHEARLYYAATLCRLGDVQAARVETAKLDRQQVSAAGWAEADAACNGAIQRPLPPGSNAGAEGLSGELYAGLAYDADASGAVQLQTDFGFEDNDEEDGLAAIAGTRLLWRGDGYASGGGLYAGASLTSKHDISGPDQDYDILQVRFGWGRLGARSGFSIGPLFTHSRLSGDPYVTEYGAQGELLLGDPSKLRLRLRAEGVAQDYKDGFPGDRGDGSRFDLSAAIEARLGQRGQWALGVAGELKNADEKVLGYRGWRLFGAIALPVMEDHYIALSGTLRHIDFRDVEFYSDRKDLRGYARAAYGLPLGGNGLFIEGAGSYTFRKVSLSNSPDLKTYHSPGAELRLLWKF